MSAKYKGGGSASALQLAASKLAGRGSAGGAGDAEEITLGTNLTMSGTTLNANAGSGAPSGAQYIVGAADAGLSDERVATDTATIDVVLGVGTAEWNVIDDAITDAKLADMTARSLKGRAADSTGDPGTISGAGVGTVPIDGGAGGTLAFGVFSRLLQALSIEGDISPTQLTASVNNYDPANNATAAVFLLTADAAWDITGLAGGSDGKIKILCNLAAFNITLKDASASSTAANRFELDADIVLKPGECAILRYDVAGAANVWRCIARNFRVGAHSDGSIVVSGDTVQVGVLASDAQHGARGGGTQHAVVVAAGAAGFMSGADKTKLDGLPTAAVPEARTITAGAGLTGGGDLSANRTLDVAANADGSIVVNANDVQVGVLATDGQHGNRGGGALHANAVAGGAAGFMSGTDKTNLDAAVPNTRTITAGNGLTGGGDLSANRTLDVAADDSTITVSANGIKVATAGITETQLAVIVGNVVFGLTDGANIAVNRDNGKNQKVTLGGNRTMDAPTGTLIDGMFLIFAIRQDATGNRTITFASGAAGAYRATAGCSLTPTLSTGANKQDYVVARYVSADDRWDLVQLTLAA